MMKVNIFNYNDVFVYVSILDNKISISYNKNEIRIYKMNDEVIDIREFNKNLLKYLFKIGRAHV